MCCTDLNMCRHRVVGVRSLNRLSREGTPTTIHADSIPATPKIKFWKQRGTPSHRVVRMFGEHTCSERGKTDHYFPIQYISYDSLTMDNLTAGRATRRARLPSGGADRGHAHLHRPLQARLEVRVRQLSERECYPLAHAVNKGAVR